MRISVFAFASLLLTAGCNDSSTTATTITVDPAAVPAAATGQAFSMNLTADGTPPMVWTISQGHLPEGLLLSSTEGTITGTPTESGTFEIRLSVHDRNGRDDQMLTLEIAETGTAPTVTTETLAQGSVGTAYSEVVQANGTAPFNWSIDNGTLPNGLSIGPATGVIAGTPTQEGTFPFRVLASNSAGADTQDLSIVIGPAPAAPEITGPTTIPDATLNAAYSLQFTVTGTAPITWSVPIGTLPQGLQQNNTTGEISGTPTQAGQSDFTVRATNSEGNDERIVQLTVAAPPAISSLGATSAIPGATLTINGSGFSATPSENTVDFGTFTEATVLAATTTELQVEIPPTGTGTVDVTVETAVGTSNAESFTFAPGTVLFVDAGATGADNGVSWRHAYTSLQDAFDAVQSGEEIWIKAGRYIPMSTFTLARSGVTVRGGFDGTESQASAADPVQNPTYLDADVNGDDTSNYGNRSDNRSGLLTSTSADAVYEGLILRGVQDGTALSITSGSPTFNDVEIRDSDGLFRVALYVNESTPTFNDCVIAGIRSSSNTSFLWLNQQSMTMNRCVIADNVCTEPAARTAMGFVNSATLTLNDCLLVGNSGGDYSFEGRNGAHFIVDQCTIAENDAETAIFATYSECDLTFTNSILRNDTAEEIDLWNTGTTTLSITSSNIKGGTAGIATGGNHTFINGGNNTDVDPQYTDAADPDGEDDRYGTSDDGLIPGGASPMIDAGHGNSSSVLDLRGATRPSGVRRDCGAYEVQVPV